ncbi:MAG: hypothetical protein ACOC3V_02250 [bacterium]
MVKKALKYKNQVVGYLDYMIYDNDSIQEAHFHLFDTVYYEEIIQNIQKSVLATFDNDIKNDFNGYNFKIENELLIIKKK